MPIKLVTDAPEPTYERFNSRSELMTVLKQCSSGIGPCVWFPEVGHAEVNR